MPQRVVSCARKSAFQSRWQRRPFVESLEGRMVLSTCGVECELIDGQLHIHGTAASDNIAVQYDAASSSIKVVGGVDEVVGQFPLADIQRLNLNGLSDADQFKMDSLLFLPISYSAEGESLGSSSDANTHGHQHGVTSSSAANIQADELESLNSTSSPAFTPDQSKVVPPIPLAHFSHLASTEATPVFYSHSDHVEIPTFVPSHAAHSVANQSHAHTAAYSAVAATAVSAAIIHHEAPAKLAVEANLTSDDHGTHPETKTKAEPSSKLVPKRCTVTDSGGTLVTSVDGKRQCDCDAKAQAAQEIKQQLAAGEQGPAGLASLAALADCQPCQRSALLAGLAADFALCSCAKQL